MKRNFSTGIARRPWKGWDLRALAKLPGPYSSLLNVAGVPMAVGNELTMKVNYFGLRHFTESVFDRIVNGGTVVNVASIAGNNWRKRRG